jgi:hypothetical protein
MHPVRITKIAASLHVGLAIAAIYYALRINNYSQLSEISAKEILVMAGIVLLPLAYAWIGLRLARTDAARWLLAIGQTIALALFAATFVMVARSVEPMAPLLFLLISLWLAGGLSLLLLVVWLVGRRGG